MNYVDAPRASHIAKPNSEAMPLSTFMSKFKNYFIFTVFVNVVGFVDFY